MLTLTKDRALALALLVMVAVMWVESSSIRPPTSWQPYGSALFPRMLLVTIGLLSLLLLIRSLFTRVAPVASWRMEISGWFARRKYVVALFILFGLYAALLPLLGYIVATIGFLVASFALLLGVDTKRKWLINLGISCTFVPLVFVIFRYGLNVWLP
ncbi:MULTISPECIES: tripartite tricarboxylate transporter TctB family protein [unclassified Halomonas]|uniref:tripartite tricarboxylate transporter TctB family protein n=1 Tax=unclassified Halomonas TaxID=2609666 RepID=UPI001EF431E7|nr:MULTISPECIES: tripartite tricarboxylate transporter TctB family protein [unclassified Halomonas]MCG7577055.1 tripartite tricarboxylate transporter TctB family protein [Halomonas sp. MMH1-48]MCG7604133.1 tripartite tricarboxylate transporter TctB family protein [Halomonas sp. MM17-34]MCG7613383.1 tripartite tricarboxylate transporter TctB family protein [Halomonas sp. MM17-29]MCG7620143.1 tripartite tricarboxylate transporter TctB family protein [Halomonas sp. DSH1-27]